MKRWRSRDATKLKLGLAAFILITGLTAAGMHGGQQQSAELNHAPAVAQTKTEQISLSEKSKISVTQTNIVTTEEEVPFSTTQTYDGTLPKDSTVTRVEGRNGKKTVKTEIKTKDGVEISRALISEEIIVPPVAQIVAIGTKIMPSKQTAQAGGDCDPRYDPCVKKTNRDLDCSDVRFRVKIITVGEDPHGFDKDDDGIGCETYPDLKEKVPGGGNL